MSIYDRTTQRDLRLTILEILAHVKTDVTLHELRAAIEEVSLHQPGMEALRQEVRHLDRIGLLRAQGDGAAVSAATITEAGQDVATGRTRHIDVGEGGRAFEEQMAIDALGKVAGHDGADAE